MSPNLLLFVTLLARLSGFFLLSPFFHRIALPFWIRGGVALTCSLLLLPPLLVPHLSGPGTMEVPLGEGILKIIEAAAMGYLFGFLFSLLFEAVACAGEVVGALSGFSTTSLLDPLSQVSHPFLSTLFTLTLFALFFALDLHHFLLRFLYTSFSTSLTDLTRGMVEGMLLSFQYAVTYALFPLTLLLLLLFGCTLLARYFPSLPLFWIGLPLQLLVGSYLLVRTVGFFDQIMQRAYYALWLVAKKMFFSL